MAAVALKQQAFARPHLRLVDAEPENDASGYVADRLTGELFPETLPQADLFGSELLHDAPLVAVQPEFACVASGEADGDSGQCARDSVSSHRNLHDAEARNVRDAQDRNLRPVLDQKFPTPGKDAAEDAPIDAIGTNEFTEICGDALYAAFGRMSAPIKRIAQVANVNERTAKNWWEKKCAPGPIHTLRLMAHVPEFQGRMRELAAMERDIDPDFQRAMADMVRLAQRHGFGGR